MAAISRIMFADIEAYAKKYYEKYGRVREYIVGGVYADSDEYVVETNFRDWIHELIRRDEKLTIYFHNGGGYDYHFLLPIVFDMFEEKDIAYFIDEKKKIFQIKICFGNKKWLKFKDSFKIWPLPLSKIGEAVGLEKLDYGDYDILDTFESVEDYKNWKGGEPYKYFIRDLDIPKKFAEYTKDILSIEDYKLTLASTAKYLQIKEFNEDMKNVDFWIKDETVWNVIKKTYRGGFTWNKYDKQLKVLENISEYDVVSLYPSIMKNHKLPFGRVSFEDLDDHTYKIYAVDIKWAKAKVVPFIATSKLNEVFLEGDRVDSVYKEEINDYILYINNYEYELFEKLYDGEWKVNFQCSFRERHHMFHDYIEHFADIKMSCDEEMKKEKSKKKVNKEKMGYLSARRMLVKLFLNSLYGKFGENILNVYTEVYKLEDIENDIFKPAEKLEYYNDERVVRNDNIAYVKKEDGLKRNVSFIPLSEAIASKSRIELVKAIVANWDNFVYCDTDSIHLIGDEEPKGIKIGNEFGEWTFEGKWDGGIYRRAKHYLRWMKDGSKWVLKGGGFNVNKFNKEKSISPEEYIKIEHEVNEGKTMAEIVNGGIIIYTIPYIFKMSKDYLKRRMKDESRRNIK